ncbi:hypothetical protein A5700_23480 [Mycobacterium sp. E1214]|nr:hypothetical protein A5700_23480 [Mycobacterium sp. E1214]OBH31799.1 hypothetical protein A5693_01400 [Mycobacterium sp. E1319]
MDPANRTVLGVSLAVAGMMTMSVTALLMGNILGGSVFAVKFEEGTFPPNSAGVVQQGLVSVFAATVLAFVSAGLAASAVVIRPHTVVQVVGALMLMALIPVLLALWLCYGLAF